MAFNNSSCHYQDGLKVLYDGSKHFWRTRTNIDVVVALHTNHNCIEIVCFNPTLALKAPRIYLNYSSIKSRLNQAEISEKLKETKETATRQKRHFVLKDANSLILNDLSLNYIFQRLDFAPDCTKDNFRMMLSPLSGDHAIDFDGLRVVDCITSCPQLLIPVTVEHRPRVGRSEVEMLLSQLNCESNELHKATKYAELLISSADGFTTALKERKKALLKGNLARQRWHHACHRIIIMNSVEKAKERILRSDAAEWYQKQLAMRRAEEEAALAVATIEKAKQAKRKEELTPPKNRTPKMSYSNRKKDEQGKLHRAVDTVRVTNAFRHAKQNNTSDPDRDNDREDPLSLSQVAHISPTGTRTMEDEKMHDVKLPPIQIPKTNKKLFLEYPSEVSLMERERARHYRSPCHRRKIMTNYHKDIERDPYFVRENERRRELNIDSLNQDHEVKDSFMPSLRSVSLESASSCSKLPTPPSLLSEFNKSIVKLDQYVPLEAFCDPYSIPPTHYHSHPYHPHKHHTQHITPEQFEEQRLHREQHKHGHHQQYNRSPTSATDGKSAYRRRSEADSQHLLYKSDSSPFEKLSPKHSTQHKHRASPVPVLLRESSCGSLTNSRMHRLDC